MGRKLTTIEFIDRAVSIHGDKYDYSLVEYKNNRVEVKIICPVHGIFNQRPEKHLHGNGCQKCGKKLLTQDDFIDRVVGIHGDKYDYSLVEYIDTKTKVKIICPDHGVFEQTPHKHMRGVNCKYCASQLRASNHSLTLEQIIQRASILHDDKYEYSLINYEGHNSDKIQIICSEHGVFEQRVDVHLRGSGCQQCAVEKNDYVSIGENEICETISTLDYRQSDRSIIYPLELDIYIPSKNLAIEYNGLYWHSEQQGKDRNYHLNKTELCEDQNIQLIHIFEDEWIHKPKIVRSRLRNLTGQIHRSIYARKCEIREIDTKTKGKFLNKYHIQGNDKSRVKLGLFYKDRLVAVMTFGKSRYSKKVEWELIRYCTISNFRIIGGAGKLLKHFERNYKPKSLVSYADRRWSQGKVYKALGFIHSHNSTPNYFYVFREGRKSRVQFQKHKLKDKLEIFDASKTEYQNMLMNSIDRIWDSGNMVFTKEY